MKLKKMVPFLFLPMLMTISSHSTAEEQPSIISKIYNGIFNSEDKYITKTINDKLKEHPLCLAFSRSNNDKTYVFSKPNKIQKEILAGLKNQELIKISNSVYNQDSYYIKLTQKGEKLQIFKPDDSVCIGTYAVKEIIHKEESFMYYKKGSVPMLGPIHLIYFNTKIVDIPKWVDINSFSSIIKTRSGDVKLIKHRLVRKDSSWRWEMTDDEDDGGLWQDNGSTIHLSI